MFNKTSGLDLHVVACVFHAWWTASSVNTFSMIFETTSTGML